MSKIHVIVTTSYQGVFYGQIDKVDFEKSDKLVLENANNVIYWSSKTEGFLGLSNLGPNKDCRIGKVAGGPIVIHSITSVTQCSPQAIEAWAPYQV